MKNLIIIDGHALIYRSHYALLSNPLVTRKNQPTSAIYGFLSYLFKLENLYPEHSIVIAMDPKGKSFRNTIYNEYKANRKPTPDELRSQIPLIVEIVGALGFVSISAEGFEADDVIGTLARFAGKSGISAKIVSADKDLMQLVNDRVHMLAPTNSSKFIEIAREQVIEKFGVPPEKIHDFLALMGDTSDNIPGLAGVGPKSAVKILENCGTVANLLADPQTAGNEKFVALVRENLAMLELSYKLTELADVPLDLDENSFERRTPDVEKIRELFKDLEFEQFLRNLKLPDGKEAKNETQQATTEKIRAQVIDSDEKLDELINRIRKSGFVSIDTETTGLEIQSAEIVGISFAVDESEAFYLPLGHNTLMSQNYPLDRAIGKIRAVLEDQEVKKIGQNLKYDCQILRNYGITMRGISFDTMLAAYVLDSTQRFNLEALSHKYLGLFAIPISDIIGKGAKQVSFAQCDVSSVLDYVAEDVILPQRLKKFFETQFDAEQLHLFENVEMPLLAVLADMEYSGIKIDRKLFADLSKKYADNLSIITDEIYLLAGERFNINSPKQLADILFEKLRIPPVKKTQSGYSTDAEVLEKISAQHPIVPKLLDYREKQKLLSTYITALPAKVSAKTGRLHTSFNQTGTSTGRLSSSDPNLQNIPVRTDDGKVIREGFVAEKGKMLLSADYSQIELRILAHLSQDDVLISAFQSGADIHRETAARCYGVSQGSVTDAMRRAAKTINFGLMYGMGAHSLADSLGVSFGEAKRFMEKYFAQFPKIKICIENLKEDARKNQYTKTLFGRRMPLPAILSDNRILRENAERIAVNAPVQGSAADIVKIAMINIHGRIAAESLPLTMLLQVHDEIVVEVPADAVEYAKELMSFEMSRAADLLVPLTVDIGVAGNWAMAH